MPRLSLRRLARDVLYAQDSLDLLPSARNFCAATQYVRDLSLAGSLGQDWINRHPLVVGWLTAFCRQNERLETPGATPATTLPASVETWLQERKDGVTENPRYTHAPPPSLLRRLYQVGQPPSGPTYVVIHSADDIQVLGLLSDPTNEREQLKVPREALLGRFTEVVGR